MQYDELKKKEAGTRRQPHHMYLHGRPSRHMENVLRRPWTRTEVCHRSQRHIAELRRRGLGITIEIRWCPSHADAKGKRRPTSGPGWRPRSQTPAAWSGPDTRIATGSDTSLASLKREFSEAKWSDAQAWTKAQLARTKNSKYRPRKKQKPDPTVARVNKRLASRFYQLKTGHCLTES